MNNWNDEDYLAIVLGGMILVVAWVNYVFFRAWFTS